MKHRYIDLIICPFKLVNESMGYSIQIDTPGRNNFFDTIWLQYYNEKTSTIQFDLIEILFALEELKPDYIYVNRGDKIPDNVKDSINCYASQRGMYVFFEPIYKRIRNETQI